MQKNQGFIRRSLMTLVVSASAMGAMLAMTPGCANLPGPRPKNGKVTSAAQLRGGPLTPQQLQWGMMAFADRFLARIEQATDDIEAQPIDAKQRALAHAAKYYPSLAIVTSAADPEPEVGLLDMVTTVTLEHMVWKGGWADRAFGPYGTYLLTGLSEMETEVWALAAKVLNPEQLTALRGVIEDWRAAHPNQDYVSTVRFDDFMFLRDQAARKATSLIKLNLVVANADEAVAEIRESRLFAERALFLAGRMPLLIAWQTELVAYELALSPEIRQTLDNMQSTSAAITQLSDDLHALPDRVGEQMQRSMDMLDQRQEGFRALVNDMRSGIDQAQRLADRTDEIAGQLKGVVNDTATAAGAMDQMFKSADTLAARFEPAPSGVAATHSGSDARPFDIRDYTKALTELTAAARELNSLMAQTDTTLQSPQWQSRINELNTATQERLNQLDGIGQSWLGELDQRAQLMWDRFLYRGVALIFIGCVLILTAGLVFRRYAAPR